MKHFSPIIRFETVQLLLPITAGEGIQLHQLDVKTAVLNGEINKDVSDLAFEVGALVRYGDASGSEHWVALKRILRYLKNTRNLGLYYRKSDKGELIGFSDSDWAGDHDDRKSTSSYIFLYNESPISWNSQKQKSVALSTVKAKYMVLSAASQECIWIINLLCNIERPCDSATVIFEDNQSTISLTNNP
ncbi:uncharacterized protein [Lepeophtheirus salmonis]|uniref:uncharacterized protein n=1 Tax=Lepeophtheirus salmonis TaxID=72036 RepID=UPI003AF3ED2E